MPIEMPRGLPFSVDTWTPSSKRKRHHFLTHAHKDHSSGILTHASFPVYCTRLTKSLILQCYPQIEESSFVCIEVGGSLVVEDPDGDFTVTVFDANHCPGAVMFLFEGEFGNILHTGDCRLTPECLQNLPEKYRSKKGEKPKCQLDVVFLDCTFGKFCQKLPSKRSAIQQVINCIWQHPAAAVVYLTCNLLGQEDILVNVSQTFGSKIFVDKTVNTECFQALALTVPEILTEDPASRFHLFDGFPKLYERAAAKLFEAKANFQPEPLVIRPSAQWYACEEEYQDTGSQKKLRFNEAVKDQFGVWHVCYSMHSSREELEWALQLLTPRWVVSTTPSCRAMELGFVKKHCLVSHLSPDDPLWKLFDIAMDASTNAGASVGGSICSPVADVPPQTSAESRLPLVKVSSRLLSLSPSSKRPPLTLFGIARLGVHDNIYPHKEKNVPIEDQSPELVSGAVNEVHKIDEDAEVNCDNKLRNCHDGDLTSRKCERSLDTKVHKWSSCLTVGSSRTYSETLRKTYRSMNVPVPRPLPSLVELMNSCKRRKRRFEF